MSDKDKIKKYASYGKTIYLYSIKDNIIKDIPLDKAVSEIYYLRYRVPTETELEKFHVNYTVNEIKELLSTDNNNIPLYDAYTNNIYIVQRRNVYIRIINHDYRFPDKLIIKSINDAKINKMNRLKKNPDLENDKVFMRSIRKIDLMINFMDQFDFNVLYDTYLNVFYKYAPEIGNKTYTCIRRSFIPHKGHLKPYYTKDEVLKLGMNMELIKIQESMQYIDFKDSLTTDDYRNICSKIQENDVSADILIKHQNYIVKKNLVGLIQYYTIQGSYFMNQYLRGLTKYEYRNDYLEENIINLWNLVLHAPAFDNDYILYRFVNTDDYMRNLKIGDIFQDKGFMSTTRDPFYRNDLYKFGFILIKIYIPKGVKGVGLCLETLSHFPNEEEIIIPPLTKLKLISKNNECAYYNPDESFVSNIKTRYEFEWMGTSDVKFTYRPELNNPTQTIDFITIKKIKTMSLKEKIDFLMKTYFDPMNRILCKIGNKQFYVVGEWYNSTGVYAEMYSIKASDGFSLYSIYDGYMLFMIEIGESDGHSQIKVNYYTKYSRLNRQELLGDDNFVKFISSIAYYFEIPNVVIYADYMSCDILKGSIPDPDKMQGGVKKQRLQSSVFENSSNDKTYDKRINAQKNNPDKQTDVDDVEDIVDPEGSENYTGGSYCLDFYQYLKYEEKRYISNKILNVELQPMFSYYDLDSLKTTKPLRILRKEDRDEIYQIYTKNYILDKSSKKDNLADFYIWMIENKCYLMDIFIKKMDRIYRNENPFKKDMYILDAMAYLYNRRYIHVYSRYIKMIIDEEHQLLTIPKNEYRIRR